MTPAQIRELRQSLGLTAGAFARAVGATDDKHVAKWERGAGLAGPTRVLLEAAVEVPALRKWLIKRAHQT